MNTNLTNLTDRILQTIDYSGDLIKDGIDFTKEQAPLVVQEFLTWTFLNSMIIGSILLLVVLFMLYFLIKYCKQAWNEWDRQTHGVSSFAHIFLFIIMISLLLGACCNLKEALKVKMAPRVYLIEWAAKQVKN